MTARRVTVELLELDESHVADLRVTGDGSYSEEINGSAGAMSGVTVPAGVDSGWDDVDVDMLARFSVTTGEGTEEEDTVVDHTAVVRVVESTPVAGTPGERQVTLSGLDWLAEFDDAPISPPLGVGVVPTAAEVYSDWRCPWIDTSGWPAATFVGPVFHADIGPDGSPFSPSVDAKPGVQPRNFTDPLGGWIWGGAVDGNGSHPVDEVCYFALDLSVDAGSLVGVMTADDTAAWAGNGVLRERGVDPPAYQWRDAYALGEEVTAGTFYFRARAVNRATFYPNPSNLSNPGAFAATFYQPQEES